jgi:diguanylate cyclase (GGDEF)-like protein
MDKQPLATIGLITPHLGGVFNGAIITSAYRRARQHGLRLLVVHETPAALHRLRLAYDHVAGWLALSELGGVEQIAAAGAPVVTICAMAEGLPAVMPDNHSAALGLVEHLIAHGHRRIAFIGRLANCDMAQRYAGYRAALAAHGIPFDPRLLVDLAEETEEQGAAGARALLATEAPFSALVAGNDFNAIGAITVLRAAGRRVPDDLAVVGFDDIDLAQAAAPPLTTAHQSYVALAALAVDRLRAQIADPALPADVTYAPTALVIRRSCGCHRSRTMPVADPDAILAAPDWKAVLGQQLARLVSYPYTPDPALAPAQIWPGMATLIGAVERVIAGGEPPAEAAIDRAWSEAVALTANLDPLNTAANLIEEVALRHASAIAPGRLLALNRALQQIRGELARTLMARRAEDARQLDAILYTNHEVSTTMLSHSGGGAPELTWLRHIDAPWGVLGLWVDPARPTELALASHYLRDGGPCPDAGARFAPAGFPLGAACADASAIVTLVPLRSPNRDWGILAIAALIDTSVSWNNDPFAMWARMLSAALERAALMKDLADQQQGLMQMYQREQLLTATLRASEERLRHSALHDALTGLPNRSLLLERLDQAIQRGRRSPEQQCALLFLDLDRFKTINDSLGHQVGDQLLIGIARRLQGIVRSGDTVARLGGDEFVILLEGLAGDAPATAFAERIQEALHEPFTLGGHALVASASIGILIGARDCERPEDLLRDADAAMYRAKALGRGRHEIFSDSLREVAPALHQLPPP